MTSPFSVEAPTWSFHVSQMPHPVIAEEREVARMPTYGVLRLELAFCSPTFRNIVAGVETWIAEMHSGKEIEEGGPLWSSLTPCLRLSTPAEIIQMFQHYVFSAVPQAHNS
jgi:hypothetical protein